MKLCAKCNHNKDESEFRTDNSRKDRLNVHCTSCLKILHNERYQARYKEKNDKRCRERHHRHKLLVEEYLKDKSCVFCGEDENCALDFHHVDGNDKLFTISGNHQRAWSVILEEINKCVILCANCHRKHHHGSLSHLIIGE